MKVTIGTFEYDVFEGVEGADQWLAGDVMRATGWALRQTDTKARGLVSATRMLIGLPWCPPGFTFDNVPPVVAGVTAMLAADLLAKPKLFADATGDRGVKIAKAGSAMVEFFAPVEGGPPLPRALWDQLTRAGLICAMDDDLTLDAGPFVSGVMGDEPCRPVRAGPLFSPYPVPHWEEAKW